MKALSQLLLANMRELVRDSMALFWFFTFPILFVIMFGFIFSADTSQSFNAGVMSEEISRGTTFQLRQIDYLLPGILAMVLMQLGLFGAMRLVNLRERKILKRLGVTPLPRSLLIGSEVATRLLMALAQTISIVICGRLLFDVAIVGGWWSLLAIVLLGGAVFVSLGYMLVCFARTEESGQGILQLAQFPMMFLSGIFFPVSVMPSFLQPVIKAIPLTYLGDALRQVMTGASPLYNLYTDIGVLLAWMVVSIIVAIRFFQWE